MIKGWLVVPSENGQYLYIQRDGCPEVIQVKAEDEGFVIDIWSDDNYRSCVATTCASFTDLEPED